MNNMTEVEMANYKEPILPTHRGNPLIEALPCVPLGGEELYEKLKSPKLHEEEQRLLPPEVRYEYTDILRHIFQPWGVHFEIVRRINMAIKSGYTSRNPLAPGYYQDLTKLASSVAGRSGPINTLQLSNAQAPGFSIIGSSGTGKTTAINNILSVLFPQKILHEEYKGRPFPHLQIVWMKLTCPYDGGVKGLCIEFFREFDLLTGDNTLKRFGNNRESVDQMISQMSLLARRHSLGALIIDEIQNISLAKSGSREKTLSYLSTMMDTLGIPIIVIGIESAMEVLQSDFMVSRRLTGSQGALIMGNLAFHKGDWEILIKGIWPNQWTREKTPLNEAIMKALYQGSHGNVSLTVSLYQWVQQRVILAGQDGMPETITPELILSEARSDRFAAVRNMLTAIDTEEGNIKRKQAIQVQNTEDIHEFSRKVQKKKKENGKKDPLDQWEKETVEEFLNKRSMLETPEDTDL